MHFTFKIYECETQKSKFNRVSCQYIYVQDIKF